MTQEDPGKATMHAMEGFEWQPPDRGEEPRRLGALGTRWPSSEDFLEARWAALRAHVDAHPEEERVVASCAVCGPLARAFWELTKIEAIARAVAGALDNAVASGYDPHDQDPLEIAADLGTYSPDLEGRSPDELLGPIDAWLGIGGEK